MRNLIVVLGIAAVAGCNNGNKGGGNDGGGGSGGAVDMAMPSDMVDITPLPAPTATHVGVSAVTCCMVSDASSSHAVYLTNLANVSRTVANTTINFGIAGDLRLAGADGSDTLVANKVFLGTYTITPDGKGVFFVSYDTTTGTDPQAAALNYFPVGGTAAKVVVAKDLPTQAIGATGTGQTQVLYYAPQPLVQRPTFSPSGKFFLALVMGPNTSGAAMDLHVFDSSTGNDVLTRANGGGNYIQLILPDDTLFFQDVVGGTGTTTPPTTPIQNLYWTKLGGTAAPTSITTHTSSYQPTGDNQTLVILKTSGDLLTYKIGTHTLGSAPLASGVASFLVGGDSTGPVVYVGADKSVHVIGTDGAKKLDLPAAAASLTTPLWLSPDGGHAYYMQNVDTQDNRGTLMHVAVQSGATPTKVGDNVSILDVNATDSHLVYLQNVDGLGQFGDVMHAGLDGSNPVALGTKANVGGLHVVNPGPNTWFALHLTNAAVDTTPPGTLDGSPLILGGLDFASYDGSPETVLNATVHASAFEFSDDGRDAVFLTGAVYSNTALNYTGTLGFIATRAPGTTVGAPNGGLSGVTELGPVHGRKLFVNAPAATPAGIYYVTY